MYIFDMNYEKGTVEKRYWSPMKIVPDNSPKPEAKHYFA